ncbi:MULTISPECIES: bifunctional 2-polyprenyl-6-hydroxyphenol methylase/3-demethylubiquinol 3-O-methyltransferase UbiG [Paraliobacillus]|uniref:class I SAM-dependent methyltransferase n=1 Tax=Paraliobacillus TaxID=200903 RepID=UPI000DD43617|nr:MULTISPECIES: class I SAM-dependent methyltransferase [Paraliobacillus]
MLEDTGERVIPENMSIMNDLLIEHVARYHFALSFISGRVLDFATGTGFGTHIIAKKLKKEIVEVIGFDINNEALEYAKYHYYHPKSSFFQEDVTDLSLPARYGTFDTIVSFETIEHVEAEEQFLSNVYRLLKPGGKLIMSTPFGNGRGKPCGSPFHIHQLTPEEFERLFTDYSTVTHYVQNGALIEPRDHATLDYHPIGIVVCEK